MRAPAWILPAAAAVLALSGTLSAADDPRIDSATGRDVRNWPPHRLFDHLSMRLEIDIPVMDRPGFNAKQRLTIAAIGADRDLLTLDAGPALEIGSVRVDGRDAVFSHEGSKLEIRLPRPLKEGSRADVEIVYSADRGGGGGRGLSWYRDERSTPEEDHLLCSQGQPEHNHLWFPCHDFPNERLSTELVVTVPDPYEAVSNGRLVGVTRRAAAEGGVEGAGVRSTYHWKQDLPHANYLVMLAVGRWDEVNLGGPDSARPGLWMPLYAPLGAGEAARGIFSDTAAMVAHFEALFDEPYPWDKYAQVLAKGVGGAMENTSASTFDESFASMPRSFAVPVVAHELVHHWFGNLVTCKSWEHIWLNEGWASYGEALWAEKQRGWSGYLRAMRSFADRERSVSRGSTPARPGMASSRYGTPMERFTGDDNPYSKGAMVLHMLRMRLGEETFFKGARLYLDRFAFKEVETDDFRRVMEEVSGQSLERFFDQWVKRPGMPRFEVDLLWDDSTKSLTVKAEQVQKIDADNSAYAVVLPVVVKEGGEGEGRKSRTVNVVTDSKLAEVTVGLDFVPREATVDPGLTVLSRTTVRTPLPKAEENEKPSEESGL